MVQNHLFFDFFVTWKWSKMDKNYRGVNPYENFFKKFRFENIFRYFLPFLFSKKTIFSVSSRFKYSPFHNPLSFYFYTGKWYYETEIIPPNPMHEIKNPSRNESQKYHVIFFLFTSFLLLVIVREIAAQTQSLQQVYQGGTSVFKFPKLKVLETSIFLYSIFKFPIWKLLYSFFFFFFFFFFSKFQKFKFFPLF